MGELNIVQIIVMVGFIVALLVKTVLQQVRRRAEGQMPEEEPVMQIHQQEQATPAPLSVPRPSRSRVHESQVQNVRPPLGEGHFIRKSLLETQRDMRRGIILMTILGPCRALDPPDQPCKTSSFGA
jgi:flagellar biosynthesis/type III secretory pathway M-ring protein FliF/YscJ